MITWELCGALSLLLISSIWPRICAYWVCWESWLILLEAVGWFQGGFRICLLVVWGESWLILLEANGWSAFFSLFFGGGWEGREDLE
jgi:hypothetical protein